MNALNPVCKFVGILFPTLILAAMHDPILNLAAFAICIILILLSGVPPKKILVFILPIILVAVGMFFTGYRFQYQSGAPVNVESLNMTDSAFWNGMILSSRVLAYAGLGYLFVLTTDKIRLIRSFQQQLRIPPLFAYGILAAWNIFPNMAEEYRKTRAAFRARGLRAEPVSPALLKAMLVKAVYWSEALSIAMESKGFNGSAPRTEYHEIKLNALDILFPVVTIGGLIIIVLIF